MLEIALQKTKYGKSHYELLKTSLYEKAFRIIKIMETSPNNILKVFSHRDLWKNNLMFKFEENCDDSSPLHCVLLDYQTARYLPITVDVLMTIVCTTRKQHRDEFYDCYVKFYYEQLSNELQKFGKSLGAKMSFESFVESCTHHITFALVYNVILVMITTIPREYFVDGSEDDYRDFAEGNRSKIVLDYMDKDVQYRLHLIEAVEAAVEDIYGL